MTTVLPYFLFYLSAGLLSILPVDWFFRDVSEEEPPMDCDCFDLASVASSADLLGSYSLGIRDSRQNETQMTVALYIFAYLAIGLALVAVLAYFDEMDDDAQPVIFTLFWPVVLLMFAVYGLATSAVVLGRRLRRIRIDRREAREAKKKKNLEDPLFGGEK
jgi:hypothetical protein